jgi:hypothetical protein
MPTFQLPKELNNSNKDDVEFPLDPTQQKMQGTSTRPTYFEPNLEYFVHSHFIFQFKYAFSSCKLFEFITNYDLCRRSSVLTLVQEVSQALGTQEINVHIAPQDLEGSFLLRIQAQLVRFH